MNTKLKTLLGIAIFVIFIVGSYMIYNNLLNNYQPNEKQLAVQENDKQETEDKIKAPDFTVVDMEGNDVKLSDFFGKPIVLNFWASWCPPCKSEMPHFDNVYLNEKDEVLFLMVDLVDGQRETIEKGKNYIKESGYAFPVYFDVNQDAAYTYGISSIPSTIFIDEDGNIVTGYQGAINEKTLKDAISLIK